MLSLLTSRHLRRFFFAHFQSQLGSGAAYVALVPLFALGGTALVAMSLLGALVLHPHDRSATADAGPEPSGLPA